MKNIIFFLLIFSVITFTKCEADPERIEEYEFEAKVKHSGIDCGTTYLIDLVNLTGDANIISASYYANNLPAELKVIGLKIKLNCRFPNKDERYVCTTLGFAYPHIVVTEAEKIE